MGEAHLIGRILFSQRKETIPPRRVDEEMQRMIQEHAGAARLRDVQGVVGTLLDRIRRPYPMFEAMSPVNRCGSWGTTPRCRR